MLMTSCFMNATLTLGRIGITFMWPESCSTFHHGGPNLDKRSLNLNRTLYFPYSEHIFLLDSPPLQFVRNAVLTHIFKLCFTLKRRWKTPLPMLCLWIIKRAIFFVNALIQNEFKWKWKQKLRFHPAVNVLLSGLFSNWIILYSQY